ncbi:MAG: S41 family peptidase [Mariniphaga sp.]|nr:S41 family peptidase [Mariniphaga sp.]
MNYFSSTKKTLLLLALLITFGQSAIQAQDVQEQAIKFGRVLNLIERFYVDTTNINRLTENAISEMLSTLDPHSVYISKDEVAEMNQPLEGNFEGIGISFNVFQDTLMVMTTIPGGPSELVGLRPGDRIIKVDAKVVANIKLKTPDVFKLLRGDKGTKVNLTVLRKGEPAPLEFTIIRDKIPIFSLDASFMLTKETAYIKLNKFAATTIDEYKEAMKALNANAKVKNLVLDLRGNGGGFLGAAYELANQFLEEKKLIVYTEGTHSPRRDYLSTTRGDFTQGNLVILIDEGSASASEIVSGAIQDWDRGVLIGRRSFGKGLVQQPFPLNDGSMLRLTTAHYYTPAGRNIQKPYKDDIKNYRNEYFQRFEKGEMFSKDSISQPDSLMMKTLVTKRKVYAGGGIMPDIFIPMDTSMYYRYFNNLVRKNVLFPFVVGYIDKNRDQLKAKYKSIADFKDNFRVTDTMLDQLIEAGEKEGIKKDEESLKISGAIISRQIKALIARDLYDTGAYYLIMIEDDKEVEKAIEVLSDQKVFNGYLNK